MSERNVWELSIPWIYITWLASLLHLGLMCLPFYFDLVSQGNFPRYKSFGRRGFNNNNINNNHRVIFKLIEIEWLYEGLNQIAWWKIGRNQRRLAFRLSTLPGICFYHSSKDRQLVYRPGEQGSLRELCLAPHGGWGYPCAKASRTEINSCLWHFMYRLKF